MQCPDYCRDEHGAARWLAICRLRRTPRLLRAQTMRVTVYGRTYDTSHMRTFPTGDRNEPTIYIDQDCRVFVERVDGGKAVVHWASTTEIETLGALYGISELRRATRHTDFTVLPPTHPLHGSGGESERGDVSGPRCVGNDAVLRGRQAASQRQPLPDLTVLCRPAPALATGRTRLSSRAISS